MGSQLSNKFILINLKLHHGLINLCTNSSNHECRIQFEQDFLQDHYR